MLINLFVFGPFTTSVGVGLNEYLKNGHTIQVPFFLISNPLPSSIPSHHRQIMNKEKRDVATVCCAQDVKERLRQEFWRIQGAKWATRPFVLWVVMMCPTVCYPPP
jgi:hypothetical protein